MAEKVSVVIQSPPNMWPQQKEKWLKLIIWLQKHGAEIKENIGSYWVIFNVKEENQAPLKKFFDQGGPMYFISTEVSTTREVHTEYHHRCVLVQDWEDVVEFFRDMTDRVRFQVGFIRAEVFKRPRLCEKCMKHATQPGIFDFAKRDVECLCFIEKTPCGIHRNGGK